MMRTVKLQQAYAELKNDLLEEVNMVDTRIIKPAMDARDHIQPLKKTIKKRADKKARLRIQLFQSLALTQADGLREIPIPR